MHLVLRQDHTPRGVVLRGRDEEPLSASLADTARLAAAGVPVRCVLCPSDEIAAQMRDLLLVHGVVLPLPGTVEVHVDDLGLVTTSG